jgi:23S rRNA pseudouridine2605 synthase
MSKNHKKETKMLRLQKYIADCGVTSRRKAEELIVEGLVKVNGRKVTELGTKVDPVEDSVMVRGEIIDVLSIDHVYLVLNKPRGYMTTLSDPEGRKTVMDLIRAVSQRVYPVGRLDYLSEGLLIMTNDGELSNMIMHPKYEVVKTYEVKVFGKVNDNVIKKLRNGISADDGELKPKSVRIIEQLPNKTWLEFKLSEGKNREIRRICEAAGVTIDKLKRVAIGNLAIDKIKPGDWGFISKPEMLRLIGFNKDGTIDSHAEEYLSVKKTIAVKKASKYQKDAKVADSRDFSKYSKDNYLTTIKLQKEISEKAKEQKLKEDEGGVKVIHSFEKGKKPKSRKQK